jgi:hypothetical protein
LQAGAISKKASGITRISGIAIFYFGKIKVTEILK